MKKNAPFQEKKQGAVTKAKFNTSREQMHLPGIELPPASPAIWPTPGTLENLALRHLLAGDELRQDSFEATWRLAAIVHSLAGKGWSCIVRMVPSQGRARPIAAYRLDVSAPSVQAALHRRTGKGAT